MNTLDFRPVELAIKNAKEELIAFCADKNNSLEDRWETWCDAPDALKDTGSFAADFAGLPDEFIMYDGIHHADRYQTVKLKSLIVTVKDALDNQYDDCDPATIDFDAFKESVMSKNLGSFIYDW